MHRFKRRLLLCLCMLLTLGGCSVLELEGEPVAAKPSLELLSMPAYEDREAQADGSPEADGPLRVDLWLDASQVMGGINPSEDSMYPHSSRKYREGGFHYRAGNTVGWYQNVLEDFLAAADGSRIRVLRCGNERLTDSFLREMGFPADSEAALRSIRRDLLTYAVDPMPDLFDDFSAESMEGSFYSLGSRKLNQMDRFAADGGALLENPGMTDLMNSALEVQISALASGDAAWASRYQAGDEGIGSPLQYALENMDLTRLSVVVCDPATLRRLNGVDASGSPESYLEPLLRARGVFDSGLQAGLYAMRLDYMGQMGSFGAADFSEPLVWGRMLYNSYQKRAEAPLPMPRTLLVLIVGKPSHVERYTRAFNALLDGDQDLMGLRGPDDGQLSYAMNGQTVTQQPFGFSWEYAAVARPSAGYYTQHTVGMLLALDAGQVQREGAMYTAELSTGREASQITLSWPTASLPEGMSLDLSRLTNAQVQVIESLLLTDVLPNAPGVEPDEGADVQVLTLRDKRYLFALRDDPFANAPEQSPFSLRSIRLSDDGSAVLATVAVDHARLRGGYYRLRLTADLSGTQLSWPPVPWTEDGYGISVHISNAQIAEWESFTSVLTRYGRDLNNPPRQFDHAWGPATGKTYKNATIPDFPPVYGALYLSELFAQLRSAANVDTEPYIRCVFDVYMPGIPES